MYRKHSPRNNDKLLLNEDIFILVYENEIAPFFYLDKVPYSLVVFVVIVPLL
jgi:hypothetical protein